MISKGEVIKIANLARLELTEQEIETMQKDLSSILDYFELLKKAPTLAKGKKELEPRGQENATREDIARERDARLVNDILAQVPDRNNEYIKVKQIL